MSAEWIEALREACKAQTQQAVARRLGYAASTISQVLSGTYKGRMEDVQRAVEGLLMSATVTCPVLDEIPTHQCVSEQRRPFAATNALRVQLWRACRAGCPHSRLTVAAKEGSDAVL